MAGVITEITERWCLRLQGVVQGIGFRPFVWRLARELGLTGWVKNDATGAQIEVEGAIAQLQQFQKRLLAELPAAGRCDRIQQQRLNLQGDREFAIAVSSASAQVTAQLPPDRAPCPDCLRELWDPRDRRYRYPFLNCTVCGPRASIVRQLPYDRDRTTLATFLLCADCQREYDDPRDRRFHAQPIACPTCGPQLQLWDAAGQVLAERDQALTEAIAALQQGKILAVKGLGGFQLLVDSRQAAAVQRLRDRKHRPHKPLALLVSDLEAARQLCQISAAEAELLQSPVAPIVLLRSLTSEPWLAAIAPDCHELGLMLPATPLHHLLSRDFGGPLVATSGNRSGDPLCWDEADALESLKAIADLWLVHDRPIALPMDDSVTRIIDGKVQVLRRARGYVPTAIAIATPAEPLLALGSWQKNTPAIAANGQLQLAPYVGDLESLAARDRRQQVIEHLQALTGLQPTAWVTDAHPDAPSLTTTETRSGWRVQHHLAHVLAVAAEHQLQPPFLGLAWDGSGWGLDQTIWGSEALICSADRWQRWRHLQPWPLLGGDRAAKEPRRSALALFWQLQGDRCWEILELRAAFSPTERSLLQTWLQRDRGLKTSSMGRLFEAIAWICGWQGEQGYEGQVATWLENQVAPEIEGDYPLTLTETGIDWQSLLQAVWRDRQADLSTAIIATRFHRSLIQLIVTLAQQAGLDRVILSGGCFQNRFLLEGAIAALRAAGFQPYWAQQLPPNDGGIAAGQVCAVHWYGGSEHVLSGAGTTAQYSHAAG
ncbi:carbamoyltransferase HypF [Synechococcus elongatus IITB4]|uniref:carbamoyltransferase HypF n=1 Tax=Synechococcus elongatus TaxID=32046 RepID=UPI0030D112E8